MHSSKDQSIDCAVMIGTNSVQKESVNLPSFILVPNLNGFVNTQQLKHDVHYVVTSDDELFSKSSKLDSPVVFKDEDQLEELPFSEKKESAKTPSGLNEPIFISNDMIKVSGFDFLSIHEETSESVAATIRQDASLGDYPVQFIKVESSSVDQGLNLDGFSDSPLLHENSKDVALSTINHMQDPMLLDDVPLSKHSTFEETSEIADDLFVSPLTEQNTPTPVLLSTRSSSLEADDIYFGDKENRNTRIISKPAKDHKEDEEKDVEFDSDVKSEDNSTNGTDIETAAQVSPLPVSSDPKDNEDLGANEDSEVSSTPLAVPLNFNASELLEHKIKISTTDTSAENPVDVNVNILPVDSFILGNFLLVPDALSPVKFQILHEDGTTVKEVSINAICKLDTVDKGKDSRTTKKLEVSNTARPFQCEMCSATFNRLGNYTRHQKIHTVRTKEDERFHCDECGKSFIQRCDLTRHLHIHSGTEPHRCSLCGKGYIRHSDLVTHQRFHNKEKPFTCPHCAKGFSQRGDLNRHLRSIHLQVKPLTCGHCQKKFAKEATLIRHMRTSHREMLLQSVLKGGAQDGCGPNVVNIITTSLPKMISSQKTVNSPS